MNRYIWIIGLILVLGIGIYLVDNVRNAYRVLPINTEQPVTAARFSNWVSFQSEEGGFTAFFPVVPQNAKETVSIPNSIEKRKYDMYVAEQLNGTIYLVSVITYPDSYYTALPLPILRTTVDEMVSTNPNNSLENIEEGLFLGYPSVEYQITNSNLQIRGVAFMTGKTLYVLSLIAKEQDFDPSEFTHFLKNFQLLPTTVPTG